MRYAYQEAIVALGARPAEETARTIGEFWNEHNGSSASNLLDVGSADGAATEAILSFTKNIRFDSVVVVEPDLSLCDIAVARISVGTGRVVGVSSIDHAGGGFAHVLASHVLYHFSDLKEAIIDFAGRLSHSGLLTTVVRSTTCDTFLLRSLSCRRTAETARINESKVMAAFRGAGLDPVVEYVQRLVSFPREQYRAGVPDGALKQFLEFAMRLDVAGPLDQEARGLLNEMIMTRTVGDVISFSLRDMIVFGCRVDCDGSHSARMTW
ncbi:hypothetical protein [Tsukamurella pseudospumae]|uniref:hypothetical protein n=1 Tax=Tsukamurella pseudospumae TaxID=239498 RepID=UPI000AE50F36|nr:hypothetical protein [Tsukamurella pseudospumae]